MSARPGWRGAVCAAGVALLGCIGVRPVLDPDEAGPDFRLQGEYAAPGAPLAAQVVALGGGGFEAVLYAGGLPGAGWTGAPPSRLPGRRQGERAVFEAGGPGEVRGAEVGAGRLRVQRARGAPLELPQVLRRSPTEGVPPPAGAIPIFDGRGLDELADGRIDERGLLVEGARTRRAFRDFRMHLEFRIPFQPGSGQRANSGVYLQQRYEIQILDSFGEPPRDAGNGSIYRQRAPDQNLSLPPLSWQTYDIDFTAARFDAAGRRTAPARVSVLHNGVPVHADVPLAGKTGLGQPEGPDPAPTWLQDHGHPVRFRNVWVLPGPGAPRS